MERCLRPLLYVLGFACLALFAVAWRLPDHRLAAPVGDPTPFFAVAVEVDGNLNIVRFSSCASPCQRIMQMDDVGGGVSMIVRVEGPPANSMPLAISTLRAYRGTFLLVDHNERTIQVLEFYEPALAEYPLSAHAPDEWTTLTMVEEANPHYALCEAARTVADWAFESLDPEAEEAEDDGFSCPRTVSVPKLDYKSQDNPVKRTSAAPKSFRLWDFVRDHAIDVEAEEYSFEFTYQMDMLPWLSHYAPEAAAASEQIPDLKLVMRMEGTTWTAPGAPGAAQVYEFYSAMAVGLILQSMQTTPDGSLGMTGALTAAMGEIASRGLPVETITKTTIAPSMGPNAPAVLDIAAFLPTNAFPSFSSTSRVLGIARSVVDLERELPAWMDLAFQPEVWAEEGANNEYGYEVAHGITPTLVD